MEINTNNLFNDFKNYFNKIKPKDIKDIEEEQYKIINKDKIDNLIKTKKETLKSIDEPIQFFIDSNFDTDHAINVKGIMEHYLKEKKIDPKVDIQYIPYNISLDLSDEKIVNEILIKNNINNNFNSLEEKVKFIQDKVNSDYVNHFYILKELGKNFPNNKLYINESFGLDVESSFDFDYSKLDDLNNQSLIKDINDIKVKNDLLIDILNTYPNIYLTKAAGNSYDIELKNQFDKITNNDYKKTQELTSTLNCVLNKYFYKDEDLKCINEDFDKIKNTLKPLFEKANIDFDNFINLYIKDYLGNYQGYDLLRKINSIKNDNLKIVEAISEDKIFKNYENYKKYHNNKEIPELEEYFNWYKKNFSINKDYNMENALKLEELNQLLKEDYPEIFKYSNFGSFSNFPLHNSKLLEVGIDSFNGIELLNSADGSSFAAPFISSKEYEKEYKKYLEQKQKENEINQTKDIYVRER